MSCSASRSNRFMILAAESALPSDLRMIRMISSSASKTFSNPSNVDALLEGLELVLEPVGHDLEAEMQEVPENRLEIEPLGASDFSVLSGNQARQVDDDVGLERRVLEQIRHHHLGIGVPLQLQRNPHIVRRDVLDVEEWRKLSHSTTSAIRSTSAALFTA